MTFEVKNSWLMWVGAKHYPTIQDYVDEAIKLGVSKKIPKIDTAKALLEEGTVVFLAHDEGEYTDCTDCEGEIDCPECRKRSSAMNRLRMDVRRFKENLDTAINEERTKAQNRAKEALKKRIKELKRLKKEHEICPDCDENRKTIAGTGGYIRLKDGTKIDRRTISYWKRHPGKPKDLEAYYKKITVENVTCDTCSGTGRCPEARIFGFFIPSACEYILTEDEGEIVEEEMEERGFEVVTTRKLAVEVKRKCGFRVPGSVYVVTHTEKKVKDNKRVVEELIKEGMIGTDGAEISGNFVNFIEPLKIDGLKRFRGIKKWSLHPDAEEEVEFGIDALEE